MFSQFWSNSQSSAPPTSTHSAPNSSPPPSPINPTVMGGLFGGGFASAVVAQRGHAQQQALANPQSVPASSRLGALASMRHARPGTLGEGLRSGISAIHMLFGNTGQANIGNVFGAPAMQRLAQRSPGTIFSPSIFSSLAARSEHTYWSGELSGQGSTVSGVRHPPSASSGRSAMNALAVGFRPAMRAAVQSAASSNPRVAPFLAAAGVITGGSAAGSTAGWLARRT